MELAWSVAQGRKDTIVPDITAQDKELFERAREATKEAQREGDAQLKAAIAAATAVTYNPIRLNLLDLKFNNTRLEQAYWRKSNTNSDKIDAIPFSCQLVVSIVLLFQAHREHNITFSKWKEVGAFHLPNFLTVLVLQTWIVLICVGVLVLQIGFSNWFRSNRGTVLFYMAIFLWIEEAMELVFLCPQSIHGFIFLLIQCVLMSAIYRVPFCSHVRMRALGFGLQIFAALTRSRSNQLFFSICCVCLAHCLGIALAYTFDRQSRSSFLGSLPRWILDEICRSGPPPQLSSYRGAFSRQLLNIFYPELLEKFPDSGSTFRDAQCTRNTPRRALGGFAGGFGGVSSLKGTYISSVPIDSVSRNSFSGDDTLSQSSCSGFFHRNVGNSIECVEMSSINQYFPWQSLSWHGHAQSSISSHAKLVPELQVYRRLRTKTRLEGY